MSSEDIVNTHDTFITSLGIELSDDDKRLPYLYWTPSCINLQLNIASLLVQVNAVNQNTYSYNKDWTRKYCSIKTSHTGVN